MPEGADVSEHQGVLTPSFFGAYDFVILRAFNENGVRDRVIDQTWANARGQTLRGAYGWPIRGADNQELGRRLVRSFPDAEFGYWADRESSGRGLAEDWEVEEYLRGIESMGRWGGFYSNIGELVRSPYLDAQPWWMADYGPNNGQRHDPMAQAPRPPRDRPWQIHQYTSNPLDKNYAPNLDFAGDPPAEEQSEPMNSSLIKDAAGDVWVYDYDAHSKTKLDAPGYLGQLKLRSIVNAVGGKADVKVHLVSEDDGLWGNLLGDAVDLRKDVTVVPSGAVPLKVVLSGTATPA